MIKMSTLTMGGVAHEIVDEAAREDIDTLKEEVTTLENVNKTTSKQIEEVKGKILQSRNETGNAISKVVQGETIIVNDVSTVEHELRVKVEGGTRVSRYSKNLIPFPYIIFTNSNASEITAEMLDDGGVLLNGTTSKTTYINISNHPFSKYSISPFSSADGFTANRYDENIWVAYDNTNEKTYISIKAGTVCNNIIFYPQIELGNVVTEYERGVELQTVEVNEDGIAVGLTSSAPNMVLISDEGSNIECEYNMDTKTYIDQKFAELQALIQ